MKPSRKDVRRALVAGLRGALSIEPTRIVGYQPLLKGESPWVGVWGKSALHPPLTALGTKSEFGLTIVTFVIRETTNFSREMAEDLLDDLEAQIAAYLAGAKGNTNDWASLDYREPSTVDYFAPQGGAPYLMETIPVTVTVNK